MEVDRTRTETMRRLDVEGGQKDLVHMRSRGNVVLTNWANLSKGLVMNPGHTLDCGQLIPTNLFTYPQDKTPLLSQEQFVDFHW